MPRIDKNTIQTAAYNALTHHGAQDWIAQSVAHAVADAESYGNKICGLYYLESYCKQLVSGRVKGDVTPVITTPKPAAVMADAQFGFAQPAFARALPVAIKAAQENGTASLSVAHSHTCTSLGYFTAKIAAAGLIAIGFTNASPIVAPPGGNKAVIGTNPIAFSVPDGQGGQAVHFDFSTSAVALGKITMAKAAGEKIPLGWAVDAQGNPTDDPDAALKGSLVSAGGYKGWGFGIMGEILAAMVTGSVNSLDVSALKSPDGPPHGLGQFYLLVDPGTHHGNFATRLQALNTAVCEQENARLPGSARHPMDQIDVPEELWNLTLSLASN